MSTKFIYNKLRDAYTAYTHWKCDRRRKPLIPEVDKTISKIAGHGNSLKDANLSIISSNCFAGRIMQDVGMQYNTPTLGLYFWAPDYIEFLKDLPRYLNAEITFVEHSKYPIGDERRAKWAHWYPIGLLDGEVEVHFLHYYTEKEAAEKWHRRASRVNLDNLLVIGMDQNLCTEKEVKAFDELPFKHKIFFSRFDMPLKSNEYMPEFANMDSVGDPYRKGEIFYRHLIDHFSESE